ncbi:MAG: TIGR03790 family protein, partial [Planctomycetota bacterium]
MRRATIAVLPLIVALTGVVLAGGSAENAVLVVDPAHPDSLRVANHYVLVRGVPARNVIYMTPDDPEGYLRTAERNVAAFLAEIESRGIAERIDYVALAPSTRFRTPAEGLLTDSCYTVRNFAVASAYTMARIGGEVAGGLSVTESNRFFSTSHDRTAFSSRISWLGGAPSRSPAARRYFIGALLGYTGSRGNTVEEILAMIDRSAAADGTRPAGTFFLMQTTDSARSGPRHGLFPATVTAIEAAGGKAEHLMAVLPDGSHDCLGVMTGLASPAIASTDFTLLPGSFCDHLTSFAGNFATSSQVKMSAWIAKGASATAGAVEEPCNYPGKFPRPEIHLHVLSGATLGEAYFRSAGYVPFQILLYGDPLTRPFAHVPAFTKAKVRRKGAKLRLKPRASTTHPTAAVVRYDLLVDGVRVASCAPGGRLSVRARDLVAGWHEVRVLAHDDSPSFATGSFPAEFRAKGRGSAGISVSPLEGNLATRFECGVDAKGGEVSEVRVLQNGRVVAAAKEAPTTLAIHGGTLGAGTSRLVAEALFADGRRARGEPAVVEVSADAGETTGAAPIAYGFTKRVPAGVPSVVELPATCEEGPAAATVTVLDPPARAVVAPGSDGPFTILTPDPDASEPDAMTFRVTAPGGESGIATVTLLIDPASVSAGLAIDAASIVDEERARRDLVEISGAVDWPDGYDPSGFDP